MNKLPDLYSELSKNCVRIRGIVKDGMTVRQLIDRLRYFNMDSKVVYYDNMGSTYDIISAVQDGKNKVAIF